MYYVKIGVIFVLFVIAAFLSLLGAYVYREIIEYMLQTDKPGYAGFLVGLAITFLMFVSFWLAVKFPVIYNAITNFLR